MKIHRGQGHLLWYRGSAFAHVFLNKKISLLGAALLSSFAPHSCGPTVPALRSSTPGEPQQPEMCMDLAVGPHGL